MKYYKIIVVNNNSIKKYLKKKTENSFWLLGM